MSQGAQTVTGMLVALAFVPLAWWLMRRGWRGRVARQEGGTGGGPGLPAPAPPLVQEPGDLLAPVPGGVEGVYVSTVLAGAPLERVAAHGLGARSAVRVGLVGGSLVLLRPGARSFTVAAPDLVGVRRTRGQVGKFTVEREGLVVITWRLAGVELDTGVRTRRRSDAQLLVGALTSLLEPAGPVTGPAAGSAS